MVVLRFWWPTELLDCAHIDAESRGGKEPVPAPLDRGGGILSSECIGEGHPGAITSPVLVEEKSRFSHELAHPCVNVSWKKCSAVFVALAGTDSDNILIEVEITDTQGQALGESETAPVDNHAHEMVWLR